MKIASNVSRFFDRRGVLAKRLDRSAAASPLRARLGNAIRNESAVSGVEFAIVAPLALFLLLAGFDTGRYILTTQHAESLANSVAEMLSQTAASTNAAVAGDGLVYWNDLDFYGNSAIFSMPEVLWEGKHLGLNWWQTVSVNMASIKFTATPTGCTTNCTYTPKVVWTYGQRACNTTFTSTADTSTYSPTKLPIDVYGPGSLIVIDVSFNWAPTFGSSYLGWGAIQRSVYMTPRNVPLIEYSQSGPTGSGPVSIC